MHGLFDEMENPFLTRNVVQTLSEEFFEGRAQVDVRCHTQVFKGQAYPAVEFSLFDDRGPVHLTLRDAHVMGELFQRLIQSSWCKPLVVAHHELA